MLGYLLTAVTCCILMLISLKYNSNVSRSFAFLCTCFVLWSIELLILSTMHDVEVLSRAFHLLRIGLFFIAPALILFSLLITNTHSRVFKCFLIASFTSSLVISALNNFILPSKLVLSAWGYLPKPDIISLIHQANFVLSVTVSILIYFLAYRKTIFIERQRIAWILLAFFVSAPFGILSFNYSKIAGTVGAISFLSILAYAVFRYRLISTRIVISQFLSQGLSSAALIMGYILINEFMAQNTDIKAEQYIYINAPYLLIGFALYNRMAVGLRTYSDPLLIDNYYDLEHEKKYIINNLSHCLDGKEIKAVLDHIFYRLVNVADYSLYLKDKQQHIFNQYDIENNTINQVEQTHIDCQELTFYEEVEPHNKHYFTRLGQTAFVPIFAQDAVIAMITLGQPNKKEQYALRDIQLLSWLGEQLAQPLRVILKYNQCMNELAEAHKTISMVSLFNTYNHDIKAPLNNISALVSCGDLFAVKEKEKLILEQTDLGINRVNTMCNLLNGGNTQKKQLIDLNQLINNIYRLFKVNIANIDFELAPMPKFQARQDMIEILLSNLFKNSIEACSNKPLHLKIKTCHSTVENTIILIFTDNGKGMPPELVDKLFSQALTTKRESGGTGVGMSVIKNIINELNGQISVDSVTDQGTTFTFSIPLMVQSIV